MIAVEDADVDQVLDNVKRMILLVMWSGPQAFLVLTFTSMSVTSPNLILSGWVSGSKGMTFWKFSLALAMGWSNSTSTSVFTSTSKRLFSISLVKTPSNYDANVSRFSVIVIDLVFIPPSSLETRV